MPVIEVKDLYKRYGEVRAVDGISFHVEEGEIFGMLGPNGAGKSTTVEIVEGLRQMDAGTVSVAGLDPHKARAKVRQLMGVQLQSTSLLERLTAREHLRLFGSFYSKSVDVDELLETVGLSERANGLAKDLSGGQKQRLSVALALVNDPGLVFLDEPTTGMDPQARRHLWDVIGGMRARGKTVLLTTHYMEEAENLCDRVAIVDHGKIIALDSPAKLIRGHFTESTVSFDDSDGHADRAELEALPGVRSLVAANGRVELFTEDVSATVGQLMSRAEANGILLHDLMVGRPNLEDVFLKLTGRRIRD